MEGTPFGRYRLIELLGRGGMGDVWRAYDADTRRVVALKVLRAHLASDPQFEQRFRREAFAAASLADPHVVPIHSFGEIDGQLYVDMRLIDGQDLQTLLSQGPLPPVRAVKIVEQIASALHAAHRIGLLHRDVKPSNILITEYDFAYLIDFGIARGAEDSGLTGTGQVIGSFNYLAPERLTGHSEDSRADIYALACVLHECLTGAPPFPGRTMERQIAAHISEPPPRPSVLRPGVPVALDAVIATGLAKNPDERYGTTHELTQAAQTAIADPTAVSPAPLPAGPRFPADGGPSPEAATQYRPASPPVEPPAPAKPKPRIAVMTGIAGAVAAVILLGVVAAFAAGRHSDSAAVVTEATTTTTAASTTAGPFTGTYTADVGPSQRLNGAPIDGATASTQTWRVRSMCGANGCVATASRRDDSHTLQDLVFDQVGDSWVAVTTQPGTCRDRPSERFKTFTLRPQPDGRLAGQYVAETPDGCFDQSSLTVTRTGDTDVASLPDPMTDPIRVVSPAEALRGRYHLRRDSQTNRGSQDHDYEVQTHCLRTGDRCISMFHDAETAIALAFASGAWTRSEEWDADGPNCGPNHVKVTGTYPLPDPPQVPIPQLTGRSSQIESSARCTSSDYIETFQRTGD